MLDSTNIYFSPTDGYVLPNSQSSPLSYGVSWAPQKWSSTLTIPTDTYPVSWDSANGRLVVSDIVQDVTVTVSGWKILNVRDSTSTSIVASASNPTTVVQHKNATFSYTIDSSAPYVFSKKASSVSVGSANISNYTVSPSENPTSMSFRMTPYGDSTVTVDIDTLRLYGIDYSGVTNLVATGT